MRWKGEGKERWWRNSKVASQLSLRRLLLDGRSKCFEGMLRSKVSSLLAVQEVRFRFKGFELRLELKWKVGKGSGGWILDHEDDATHFFFSSFYY